MDLEQKLKDFEGKGNAWLERARAFLCQARQPVDSSLQLPDSPADTEPDGSILVCPVCRLGRMRIVAALTPLQQLPTRPRAPPMVPP